MIKQKTYIKIANKSDLLNKPRQDFSISTKTGEGIEDLKTKIKNSVCNINPETLEFSTNMRQQNCLINAKDSLSMALKASEQHELQDLISIDIKSALLALNELTGEVITDDILNNIFDNFCIGK